MTRIIELSHLANPLPSSAQLEASATRLDGVPKDVEDSVRFETTRLLQAVGILLRLPQELVAQSIVILCRYWLGPDGGSMLEHDPKVTIGSLAAVKGQAWLTEQQDVAAASLYLMAKPSAHPVSPRQVLVTFEYLVSNPPDYAAIASAAISNGLHDWHLSEGKYESARNRLYEIESSMLRVLGFETHVALPYTLGINYLQTLDVFKSVAGPTMAKRCFAHLNSALFSPQLLYLTHQPSTIATAAIYLAAREVNAKLPETEWWEVFDVDREELGFVVVALRSVEGFAENEKRIWGQRGAPLTVEGLRYKLEYRSDA